MVLLKEMFLTNTHRIYKERGSSARQWNDHSEFATPNLGQKTEYLIDAHNINDISCFNPFQIN
jgi:hypothetical protein